MSQLIVVSNRVSLPKSGQSAGGLAVALNDALQDQGGIWMGWNAEQVADTQHVQFSCQQYQKVMYMTTPLTQIEYQSFYSGFSNNTLWPMLHSRSDLIVEEAEQFKIYQEVNRRFAQQIAQIAQPEDIIWVHDYHFLSLGKYCRELGLKNRIGFFLHIPFSAVQYWQQLNTAQILLTDLLEYDLIGLQTQADQSTCLDVYKGILKANIQQNIVFHANRQTVVQNYPIGVNPKLIQKAAQGKQLKIEDYFDPCPSLAQPWIIAAERVDYSKGISERIDAIEAVLDEKHLYGSFATLQIACPCRMEVPVYERLYQQVNQRIASINTRLASETWQPIYATNHMIPHADLMQLYRKSAVCWVNSCKDGMNLVAKEYIAAQDPQHPGVLILSKYAGAAEQMQQALIVDPHDINHLKKAVYQALTMSLSERISRYQALIKGIYAEDIEHWRECFLNDLKNEHLMNKNAV